jgi:hypothetical protein
VVDFALIRVLDREIGDGSFKAVIASRITADHCGICCLCVRSSKRPSAGIRVLPHLMFVIDFHRRFDFSIPKLADIQFIQVPSAIELVSKNLLPIVAATKGMANRAWIFDSKRP